MAGINLTPIAGGILNGGVIIGGIAFIVTLLVIFWLFWRNARKFDHVTIIFEKDGFGKPLLSFGKGGIYTDRKTNYKRFWLQQSNASLKADNIPYIRSPKNKYVFLRKRGNKNYEYISFEKLFDELGTVSIDEEDINSALIDFDRAKTTFGQSTLDKLLPYISLAIVGVFIVGVAYIVMKDLPKLVEAMNMIADKLAAIAEMLSKTQPTIVQ